VKDSLKGHVVTDEEDDAELPDVPEDAARRGLWARIWPREQRWSFLNGLMGGIILLPQVYEAILTYVGSVSQSPEKYPLGYGVEITAPIALLIFISAKVFFWLEDRWPTPREFAYDPYGGGPVY
jgi:hypothetical protein